MQLERAKQTSESIELAVVLALSGGLMDAYSYLGRGKVFANAQTGNMLLFGVALADQDAERALRYFFPVLSFAIGIAIAHSIKIFSHERHVHWRQVALVIELCMLIFVGFLPDDLNLLANCLTSLACGIQVQAFRKLHGHPFATTMCIGNLRSGTQHLVSYFHTKNCDRLVDALLYYGTIVTFVIGAVIGSRLVGAVGLRAIWLSPVLLAAGLALMCMDREGRDFNIAERRYATLRQRQEREHLSNDEFRDQIRQEMRHDLEQQIEDDVADELQEQYADEVSPQTIEHVTRDIDAEVEATVEKDLDSADALDGIAQGAPRKKGGSRK
ncbi:MAG: YoaK family protein [Atopobiaceae bacterium]